MSIHFYKKGDIKTRSLFEVSGQAYVLLEESFNIFEKKTSIYIDPYGKITLYSENLKLLLEILKQKFPKMDKSENGKIVASLINQLILLCQSDSIVEAVGD